MEFIKIKPGNAPSYVNHVVYRLYTDAMIVSAAKMRTTPRFARILKDFGQDCTARALADPMYCEHCCRYLVYYLSSYV
jgi:hypothetical protein